MKRFFIVSVLVAMVLGVVMPTVLAAASATPCTDAWSACIAVNGYPDAGCDAGWNACMDALYPPGRLD